MITPFRFAILISVCLIISNICFIPSLLIIGTEFPKLAEKGDTFVRVDVLPNRVYKFDGIRWIVVNKETSNSYVHDQEYVKYLVSKIETGEYDIDLLSESEKEQIEEYLTKKS